MNRRVRPCRRYPKSIIFDTIKLTTACYLSGRRFSSTEDYGSLEPESGVGKLEL